MKPQSQTIVEINEQAYDLLIQQHLAPLITPEMAQQKERMGRKIQFFVNNSFQDYIASRVLLNNDMLLQGSIMACTFMEKMLKAFIVFDDETFAKKIHKCSDLYGQLVASDQIFDKLLNKSFLDFLTKAYAARYWESLHDDFDLFISFRRTLAELDYTAFILFNSLSISTLPNQEPTNIYKTHFLHKEQRLFDNNFLIGNLDKTFWIENFYDRTYQLRMFSIDRNMPVEAFQNGVQAYNDGIFDGKGINQELGIEMQESDLFKIKIIKDNTVVHKSIKEPNSYG